MVKNLIIFLLLVWPFLLGAQTTDFGVLGGLNINFVSLKSDYKLNNDVLGTNIGQNVGAYMHYRKGKVGVLGSIEYQRTSNNIESDFVTRDAGGSSIGKYGMKLINNRLLFSGIATYNIGYGVYFGAGLSISYMAWSMLKLSDELEYMNTDYGRRFLNYNYRPVVPYVPLIIGVGFDKFSVYLQFNKGLIDNISSNVNMVKEVNNTVVLGVSYRLFEVKK